MEEDMANLRLRDFEFFTIILPGSSRRRLRLPNKFARELEVRELRDAKLRVAGAGRRLWNVKVVADDGGGAGAGGLYLARGWQQFARAHDLRDGHFLVFRYDGAAVFTVTVFDETMCRRDYHRQHAAAADGRGSSSHSDAAAGAGDDDDGHAAATSQFAATLRQCNLGKKQAQYLNVPVYFQDAHGYARKRRVVLLMGGGSWTVSLKHTQRQLGHRTAFRYGWHQFCVDNGLSAGDICSFRVLREGDHAAVRPGEDHVLKVAVRKPDGTIVE